MSESTPLNSGPATRVSAAQVRQIIASIDTKIDIPKLKDQTRFRDAGADSLDFFNIIIAIEDAYGVVIPSEDLRLTNTLEKMAEYLNSRLP
jgi:acyl carrier protein